MVEIQLKDMDLLSIKEKKFEVIGMKVKACKKRRWVVIDFEEALNDLEVTRINLGGRIAIRKDKWSWYIKGEGTIPSHELRYYFLPQVR